MSAPIRMDVDLAHVPSPGELGRLASGGQYVVLRIIGPVRDGDLIRLVAELKTLLPTHSVFESGEFHVTVFPVISHDDVTLIADELLEAAAAFRRTATRLCMQLAGDLHLSPDSLIQARGTSGRLDDEWAYQFHGVECCFTSAITGQVVDVRLRFGDEFGVLDPWFFHRFLSTTQKYSSLATKLPDGFHDTARALELLERSGGLIRVPRQSEGEVIFSGLIAAGEVGRPTSR
jgi:hypothetical protein